MLQTDTGRTQIHIWGFLCGYGYVQGAVAASGWCGGGPAGLFVVAVPGTAVHDSWSWVHGVGFLVRDEGACASVPSCP